MTHQGIKFVTLWLQNDFSALLASNNREAHLSTNSLLQYERAISACLWHIKGWHREKAQETTNTDTFMQFQSYLWNSIRQAFLQSLQYDSLSVFLCFPTPQTVRHYVFHTILDRGKQEMKRQTEKQLGPHQVEKGINERILKLGVWYNLGSKYFSPT